MSEQSTSEAATTSLGLPPSQQQPVAEAGIAARRNKQFHIATKEQEKMSSSGSGPVMKIKKIPEGTTFSQLYKTDADIYDAGPKGKVLNCLSVVNGVNYVVKIRRKGHFRGSEMTWRAITEKVMNMDRCIHVLDFHEILEDDENFYVVMEKCGGGELFKFLLTETTVPERECKRIMREILKSVEHLHQQGIIHRDIKPENIMFMDYNAQKARDSDIAIARAQQNAKGKEGRTVKLIDFDTCQEWTPQSPKSKRIIGTLGYIAPEGYLGEYSPSSDLWSVGVILYILMTGDMPFDDTIFSDVKDNSVGNSKMQEIYKKLKDSKIDWDCPPWPQFPAARDLCQQLLSFDAGNRSPSAADALKHTWLKEGE